jgi:hypothetical protein
MPIDISTALKAAAAEAANPERFQLEFGHACAERVRHLLEDEEIIGCLDVLGRFLSGSTDHDSLSNAATLAASIANHHQGSRSLDGVGHAAVSASYAVANALAGRAAQAAEYSAYAMVYGGGGYGAVSDPESFEPENSWQMAKLRQLASSCARAAARTAKQTAVHTFERS